jgi:histidinol dehydrogenase
MLKTIEWQTAAASVQQRVLCRPCRQDSVTEDVSQLIDQVRQAGDAALLALTQRFDGVALSRLELSGECLQKVTIQRSAQQAIEQAIETITGYHQAVMPQPMRIETAAGVVITRVVRPIQRVGLYVPGGQTPLISSVLMQAIPARIAGCPLRVLCTPPKADGSIDPHLMVAARLCGIQQIFTVGGAQAIAAMAYGTSSIPKVNKIFGPGNRYVTEAKVQVAFDPDGAAIDMPAGPSEVMIVADEAAKPQWLAADLLAQAEHGADSQVILICESMAMARAVNEALQAELEWLPRRAIAMQALQYGAILVCADRRSQVAIINQYAPEHLIIQRADAKTWTDDITAAGTIFLGPWASETMGDYVTGSNHVLPTYGFARSYSGLSTSDFLTSMTVQTVNPTGIRTLGAAAETLAQLEGLEAHAYAIRLRLEAAQNE